MDRPRPKVFWTRQKKGVLVFILALIPLTVYALLADLGTAKLRVEAARITVSEVKSGPFQEFIAVTGKVMPLHTVYLETVAGGRVEEVYLEEGAEVAVGEAILKLDNDEIELETMRREDQYVEQVNQLFNVRRQMEQLERQFEQRMAELDYQILRLSRVYQRNEELIAEDLISQLEFELSRDEHEFMVRQKQLEIASEQENRRSRQAQIRQLEQAVERRKKNLDVAEENLAKLVIRAPIAGRLTSLKLKIGQATTPGQRLGQIDATRGFKVEADVDQHFISRVQVDQIGEAALADQTYTLRTTKIYAEVVEGRFKVDMVFTGDAPDGVKRGQSLHIRLALGGLSEAVQVANGAFFQKTGGQWAFVVDPSGRLATRKKIRLGRENPEFFEVLAGLRPGERVITSSYDSFVDYDQLVFKD